MYQIRNSLLLGLILMGSANAALESGITSGTLDVHGKILEMTNAYIFLQPKGFYDVDDPTWTLLFTNAPVAHYDVEYEHLTPAVRIGLTLTSEFDAQPTLRLFSQSI